jgi:beta-phosphoglucomutase-like phosphatase (HAD superfamily)
MIKKLLLSPRNQPLLKNKLKKLLLRNQQKMSKLTRKKLQSKAKKKKKSKAHNNLLHHITQKKRNQQKPLPRMIQRKNLLQKKQILAALKTPKRKAKSLLLPLKLINRYKKTKRRMRSPPKKKL